jgi:hypothetical protein
MRKKRAAAPVERIDERSVDSKNPVTENCTDIARLEV